MRLKKRRKILGLALGGGSALGMAHIGVLEALAEENIKIDCIAGTSAGALIAALSAFDVPPRLMREEAGNFSWFKISKPAFSKLGLASNQAIGKIISKYIGKNTRIEEAKIPLAIIATNIATGQKVILRQGSLIKAVMASTSIPGIFAPVKIGKQLLVDGGLVEEVPVSVLNQMGASLTVAVDLRRRRKYQRPKSLSDVILNSLDILMRTSSQAPAANIYIEPQIGNFRLTDFGNYKKLISLGYQAANLKIPQIKSRLKDT